MMSLIELDYVSTALAVGDFAGIAGWAWPLIYLVVSLIVALILINNAGYSAKSPYLEGLSHGSHGDPHEVHTDTHLSPAAALHAPDNLEIVEGIGPKISLLLQEAGITSFDSLAAASPEQLDQILNGAGLQISDPTTWPEQARLAASGKWTELEELQAQLKAGRRS